jgi:hypothetical protein
MSDSVDMSIDQLIQDIREAQEGSVYNPFAAPSYHLPDETNTSSSSDEIPPSASPHQPEVPVQATAPPSIPTVSVVPMAVATGTIPPLAMAVAAPQPRSAAAISRTYRLHLIQLLGLANDGMATRQAVEEMINRKSTNSNAQRGGSREMDLEGLQQAVNLLYRRVPTRQQAGDTRFSVEQWKRNYNRQDGVLTYNQGDAGPSSAPPPSLPPQGPAASQNTEPPEPIPVTETRAFDPRAPLPPDWLRRHPSRAARTHTLWDAVIGEVCDGLKEDALLEGIEEEVISEFEWRWRRRCAMSIPTRSAAPNVLRAINAFREMSEQAEILRDNLKTMTSDQQASFGYWFREMTRPRPMDGS